MSKENHSDDSDLTIDQVIRKYYPIILKNNLHLLNKSKANADDVTQNVFMVLVEKWDTLNKKTVGAWLFGVARLKIYEFYRANKKFEDNVVSLELIKEERKSFDEILNTYQMDEMTLDKIKAEVLGMLSDDERQLYEYYFENGVSYDKLMELYSISYSAATSKVNRLKNKINHYISIKSASLLTFGFAYSLITLSLLNDLLGGR